jgi:hypothetical protein
LDVLLAQQTTIEDDTRLYVSSKIYMQKQKIARAISKGKCMICSEILAKNIMTRHIASHKNEHTKTKTSSKYFHILMEGRYDPEYWLHVGVRTKDPLEDLDYLLRNIWLECCEHLSTFTISGEQFALNLDPEYGDRGMGASFEKVLAHGMKFTHEYDFGTTTDLLGKVVGEYEEGAKRPIAILARNEPPDLRCMTCGQNASRICSGCTWKGKTGLLCKTHVSQHKHDQARSLPVVNSPRVGVCGYSG